MIKHFILLFAVILIAGCRTQPVVTAQPARASPSSEVMEASQALGEFFTLLHVKNYGAAVPLYGGEYVTLQEWNPDIDSSDYAALWKNACELNGLQCLEVRSAKMQNQEGNTFVFQVEFSNPDGSLFVLGPCCGADETEMPPVSQFEYTVVRNSRGTLVVMNTPPYVP